MAGKADYKRTLHYAVERNAKIVPDRLAVVWGDTKISWREFYHNCNRAANAFLKLGVGEGQNIGCMLRNCNQFVEVFMCAGLIKARGFNINYRYKEEELLYVLDNADAVIVVCHPEYEELVEAVRPRLPLLRHIIVCGKSSAGNLEWDPLMEASDPNPPEPPWGRGGNRTELLVYTGGTTGMPKGVLWPQENISRMVANNLSNALIKNLRLLVEAPPPSPDMLLGLLNLPLRKTPLKHLYFWSFKNRWFMNRVGSFLEKHAMVPPGLKPVVKILGESFTLLIGSPLMHGAAWIGVLPTINTAGTIYFLPDSPHFDAHILWETVQKEQLKLIELVGDAFAVPMLEALEERDYDLSSVVVLATGGVKLSPPMKKKLHEKLPNALIADTLLATEGGGAVADASVSTSASDKLRFKIDSTGKFPVMVIGEDGNFVKPGSGEVGMLAYGGPQSTGYWKDPEKTRETYIKIDGKTWVKVGDMCTVDADGTIDLIGRSHACINSGGEKVYPYEVENLLLSHAAVRDVTVVGVPHQRWGQAITAVVELTGGNTENEDLREELYGFVHEGLSDYKCPKYWVFVESMDRSDSGKVHYSAIRHKAMQALGLGEDGVMQADETPVAGKVEAAIIRDGGKVMDYEYLNLSVEDGLGILTMNRPPANAISVELAEEFIAMAGELEENDDVRCVILRSELPKYFMVGADLRSLPPDIDFSDIDYSLPQDQVMAATFKKVSPYFLSILKKGQEMMNAVERLPKPTIAVIGGHAMGGGLELCMACDFRIMARGKPRVGLTETNLSLIPSAGGTQRLPRLIGRAKALEMILLGKRLDADQAEALGLVTMAVDPDQLEPEAIAMGKALAHGATVAMGCAKRCVIESLDVSLDKGLALESESIGRLISTEDMLEGFLAFTTGRDPHYAGK
jgi:3-oxocholest-4-en-26-oate---CoA ligase